MQRQLVDWSSELPPVPEVEAHMLDGNLDAYELDDVLQIADATEYPVAEIYMAIALGYDMTKLVWDS